jgi:pimeloyl-ACP methyl ester carboxylesterase
MYSVLWALFIFAGAGIGLLLASFAIEAVRPVPQPPERLRWAPDIKNNYVEVGGNKLRYIKSGTGPDLVLLHTLRTQLDLFEKVLPELSKQFTVYALDYPGHGYSDIPKSRYDAAFFAEAVEGFLKRLDLRDVTLAGISIGGAIPLIIAARRNPRLVRVIAINPYDYAKGRGMARSSLLGRMITYVSLVPVLGETVMRLRSFVIMRKVLEGGVADPKSIPPALLNEMYLVGNRRGHYRAFISLLRNAASWEDATEDYGRINIPVLLIWGDQDWARPPEREHDAKLIPGVQVATLERGGHFLALDQPQELGDLVIHFSAVDARVKHDDMSERSA